MKEPVPKVSVLIGSVAIGPVRMEWVLVGANLYWSQDSKSSVRLESVVELAY